MTAKQEIIKLLELHPNGIWGGHVEDTIRNLTGTKSSTASRRLRELAEEGKIIARYEPLEVGGREFVKYYPKPEPIPVSREISKVELPIKQLSFN